MSCLKCEQLQKENQNLLKENEELKKYIDQAKDDGYYSKLQEIICYHRLKDRPGLLYDLQELIKSVLNLVAKKNKRIEELKRKRKLS